MKTQNIWIETRHAICDMTSKRGERIGSSFRDEGLVLISFQ